MVDGGGEILGLDGIVESVGGVFVGLAVDASAGNSRSGENGGEEGNSEWPRPQVGVALGVRPISPGGHDEGFVEESARWSSRSAAKP